MVTGIAKHDRVHEKLKILVTANKMLAAVALNPSLYQEVLWRLVLVVVLASMDIVASAVNLFYSNFIC
jgi:hypothetical protein